MCDIKVSVLMSVYNTKEVYLRKAIESILGQTYKEFEFIIVLDCPQDNSEAIVEEYKERDNRIIILKNETNIGLTKSLNRALDIAKGKYIARMDADDYSVPERLEVQYKYLEEHPAVGVVGGHVYTGIKGKRALTAWDEDEGITKIHMLFHNAGVPHPTAMFRKVLSDGTPMLYDESILKSQDYALWAKCICKTKIVLLDEVLLLYRIHESQISAIPTGQIKYSSMIIARQLNDLFGISDEMDLEIATNIFIGKKYPTYLEVKKLFQRLIEVNRSKGCFEEEKLKIALAEIRLEYIYITRHLSHELGKNILSENKDVLKYAVVKEFIRHYFIAKMKHDYICRRYKKKNKHIGESVI